MTYDPNQPPQPPQGQQPYGQPQYPPGYGQPAYGGQPMYAQSGYAPAGYAMLPPSKPTSVMVVAIIGICWAALGLLCVPFALIQIFKPDLMPTSVGPNPVTVAMHDHMALWLWVMSSNVLNVVMLLVLLVGSIGALRLRPWGRTLSIIWALVDYAVILVGMVMQLLVVMPYVSAAIPANADPTAKKAMVIGGIVGGVFGLLFGAILPTLILIFYRRRVAVEAFARRGQ